MKKLLLFFLFPFVAFTQSDGVMHAYYNSINEWNVSSEALKAELKTLISTNHNPIAYGSNGSGTWAALQVSDVVSEGSNNVSLLYGYEDGSDSDTRNDASRDKSLMSSGACEGYWNREHIFPKSLATPALDDDYPGSGTDLFNLRAIDCQMNSLRNNNVYGDGSGDSVLNSGVFFPGDGTGTGGDDYRGDVARAIMYMYIRYPSEIDPNNAASSTNVHHADMPDIFLKWNQEDPPSDIEKLRNTTFHTEQGNRNPFIDNPHIAELIWGGPSVPDWWDLASPRISFSSSSSVNETNGDVAATLTATMLNYAANVTISVTVDNGSTTAESGDYSLNLSSWTFTSDDETKDIGLTIHNDNDNHDETIVVNVDVASGSANLINSQYSVSVTDDEKELIITEIADPQDSNTAGRYVEIYNSSNKSVDLSTYYLIRWTNGNANPQNTIISLSSKCGSTLAANTFCIISNDTGNTSKFITTYGFAPDDFAGEGEGVDSNGDDNIAIATVASGVSYDKEDPSTYTVIDMFGVAGEDGSGTGHEFEDGRAEREHTTTTPKSTWDVADWYIDNDSGGGDGNQYASNDDGTSDFDPGYWGGANDVHTWTGRSSTSWATAGNWSGGVIPSSGDKVFIHDANSDPDISSSDDITLADLTVKTNGVLDIEASGSLQLSGNFSNSGTVTLNSDADKFASIIVEGTSSGNITYKRYINTVGADEWDLIGSPVGGLDINTFISDNSGVIATNGVQYAIGAYDNSNNAWSNYTSDGSLAGNVSSAGNFDIGKGYQMGTVSGAAVAFTGTITTSDQTQSIINNDGNGSGRRWNLVANPYPSYLNLASFLNENVINNTIMDQGLYGAVYGWNPNKLGGAGYDSYEGDEVVYIAPGQGFMIAAESSSAANLSFTTAMQTVSGDDDFVVGDVMENTEIYLRLYNNDAFIEQTHIRFRENMTLGLDQTYDVGNYYQGAEIASRLIEGDEGVSLEHQNLPLSAMENAVIPLVINQAAGQEFRINLHTATIPDPNVYLEDVEEGTFTNLYEGDFVYTPTSDLSGVGRFFIHMTADTMSNGEVPTSMLNAYKEIDASYITIEGLATQSNETKVSLYNILGREVLATTLNNNMGTQTISTVGLSAGIYVIKLESGSDR